MNDNEKYVIIGTAGHVDHGKTSLTKALTGEDTDRWKEEKKRGITIDIGFAHLENDRNIDISIIDVPGHERFIHNMLAGIGGIDLVIFVIAADEGIMPQTKEHLSIVKTLGICRGVIALTKVDLVDNIWLAMVEDEVREYMKGTFLEQAPFFYVSSVTGSGIDGLRNALIELATSVENRRKEFYLTRLPVDRVFTLDGFGTIVTGTLWEGRIKVGGILQVYPQDKMAKVKNIQVHGKPVQEVFGGQRVALNLGNIKKEDLHRGQVLAYPTTLEPVFMIDAVLSIFKEIERVIKHNSRVHISYGTDEVIAKVVLLDKEELQAGETALVQLRFETPVVMRKNDRFIVRFFSPQESIGGGIVIEPQPVKHKRFRTDVIEMLREKYNSNCFEAMVQAFRENKRYFQSNNRIMYKLGLTQKDWDNTLEKIVGEDIVVQFTEELTTHQDNIEWFVSVTKDIFQTYHSLKFTKGIPKEELKTRLKQATYISQERILDLYLQKLAEICVITDAGVRWELTNYDIKLNDSQQKRIKEIEEIFREKGCLISEIDKVVNDAKGEDGRLIQLLEDRGVLIRISSFVWMHIESYQEAKLKFEEIHRAQGCVTLGDFRDTLGVSRKQALLILEKFDEQSLTRMENGARILIK